MADTESAAPDGWPPRFTLDQERILDLLTGERFYSNASAALREAVLNAIDAIFRRQRNEPGLVAVIEVVFDADSRSLLISDNGDGMNRAAVVGLFTKVGASASTTAQGTGAVGEFGIGVVSYFMAADTFILDTWNGTDPPIRLGFDRSALAGGRARELPSVRTVRGTSIELQVRNEATFDLLVQRFPHWCRDVEGLSAWRNPGNVSMRQPGSGSDHGVGNPDLPTWVERAHLSPVDDPTGWAAMTADSSVDVLYRGVFVQTVPVKGVWGVKGSIDVNPKHFKPSLNREGFVDTTFQEQIAGVVKAIHPEVLLQMSIRLDEELQAGNLDKWTVDRWATLWLAMPRQGRYLDAATAWDGVFRRVPAFEQAVGNSWIPISLDGVIVLGPEVFVAPHKGEQANELINSAVRLLRNTGRPVIRGMRREAQWMRHVASSYVNTADLITAVFASELPALRRIDAEAEGLLESVGALRTLYAGPPLVDLVRFGKDDPPVLRLGKRLVINIANSAGAMIARTAVERNKGPIELIPLSAQHAHDLLPQVAKVVLEMPDGAESLGLVERRVLRGFLE